MTLITRSLPSYIVFDEQNRPWVDGTGIKVVEIVIDHLAGLNASQIHAAHPDLPLAKIHAALAYYFDHQVELDEEIARISQFVESARSSESSTLSREILESRLKKNGGSV